MHAVQALPIAEGGLNDHHTSIFQIRTAGTLADITPDGWLGDAGAPRRTPSLRRPPHRRAGTSPRPLSRPALERPGFGTNSVELKRKRNPRNDNYRARNMLRRHYRVVTQERLRLHAAERKEKKNKQDTTSWTTGMCLFPRTADAALPKPPPASAAYRGANRRESYDDAKHPRISHLARSRGLDPGAGVGSGLGRGRGETRSLYQERKSERHAWPSWGKPSRKLCQQKQVLSEIVRSKLLPPGLPTPKPPRPPPVGAPALPAMQLTGRGLGRASRDLPAGACPEGRARFPCGGYQRQ